LPLLGNCLPDNITVPSTLDSGGGKTETIATILKQQQQY